VTAGNFCVMRWLVHSEKTLYTDAWLDVRVADVELPGGRRLDHRLVRTPPGAGAVVTDARDRVLLVRRHRFITDTWAWEIPLGAVEEGELPQVAAGREVERETGWRPGPLRPLLAVQPANGLLDSLHYVYRSESATYVAPPAGSWAGEQVEWLHLTRVRRLIADGEIVCGTTLSAVLHVMLDRLPAGDRRPDPDPGPLLLRDIPGLEP
jgi:ADP-ribose pyrophosphatase YjhB (NUDIX family)